MTDTPMIHRRYDLAVEVCNRQYGAARCQRAAGHVERASTGADKVHGTIDRQVRWAEPRDFILTENERREMFNSKRDRLDRILERRAEQAVIEYDGPNEPATSKPEPEWQEWAAKSAREHVMGVTDQAFSVEVGGNIGDGAGHVTSPTPSGWSCSCGASGVRGGEPDQGQADETEPEPPLLKALARIAEAIEDNTREVVEFRKIWEHLNR